MALDSWVIVLALDMLLFIASTIHGREGPIV